MCFDDRADLGRHARTVRRATELGLLVLTARLAMDIHTTHLYLVSTCSANTELSNGVW